MAWRRDLGRKLQNDAGHGVNPVVLTIEVTIPELRPEPFRIVRRFNRLFWEGLSVQRQAELLAKLEAETRERLQWIASLGD